MEKTTQPLQSSPCSSSTVARPPVLPSLGSVLVLGREEVDTRAHSVAFQTWGPHPADEEEERSSCLKALLSDYFEKEPAGEQAERGCEEEEEEEEEDLGDAKVSKSTGPSASISGTRQLRFRRDRGWVWGEGEEGRDPRRLLSFAAAGLGEPDPCRHPPFPLHPPGREVLWQGHRQDISRHR